MTVRGLGTLEGAWCVRGTQERRRRALCDSSWGLHYECGEGLLMKRNSERWLDSENLAQCEKRGLIKVVSAGRHGFTEKKKPKNLGACWIGLRQSEYREVSKLIQNETAEGRGKNVERRNQFRMTNCKIEMGRLLGPSREKAEREKVEPV